MYITSSVSFFLRLVLLLSHFYVSLFCHSEDGGAVDLVFAKRWRRGSGPYFCSQREPLFKSVQKFHSVGSRATNDQEEEEEEISLALEYARISVYLYRSLDVKQE